MQMCGKTVCAGGWGEMDRTHMDEVRKLMSLPPPHGHTHACTHTHVRFQADCGTQLWKAKPWKSEKKSRASTAVT